MSSSSERVHRPGATTNDDRITALLRTISHAGVLTTEHIPIPGTTITVEVTRPVDINRLLDQAEGDPEQNLPYWAEVWPSGIALAAAIAHQPDRVAGRRVLELGCGLGITAALAVDAGARLTVSDYASEALALTRVTTLRHAGREPDATHQLNWRTTTQARPFASDRFPVLLAADILYEQRDIDPLFEAIDTLLADDGLLWLADPRREPADAFLERLIAQDWRVETTQWTGPWPDPKDAGVIVRTHLISRTRRTGT